MSRMAESRVSPGEVAGHRPREPAGRPSDDLRASVVPVICLWLGAFLLRFPNLRDISEVRVDVRQIEVGIDGAMPRCRSRG